MLKYYDVGDVQLFSVIFDMDGTLLDTQRICISAWDFGGEKQGYKNLGNLIPRVCGMNEAGWQSVLLAEAPGLDLELFLKDIHEYYVEHSVVKAKEGMFELLDFLKSHGVKMAVASGTRMSTIKRNFNEINALDYFDAIVGGDMVENGKPAPDVFLIAAQKMGAAPEDCFVFEDSENGMKAAKAAGMRCFSVPDVGIISSKTKETLFASLDKLSDAIEIFEKML